MSEEMMGWLVKLLGVFGLGGLALAWVNRRKTDAEADESSAGAELKRTQAKHIQFEELVETVALLSMRMKAAERELASCKAREAAQAARMTAIEAQHGIIAATLRRAWPADHTIPPDMIALLDEIESKFTRKPRRTTRQKSETRSK